jgi:hypothetical protein
MEMSEELNRLKRDAVKARAAMKKATDPQKKEQLFQQWRILHNLAIARERSEEATKTKRI